MWVFIGRTDVEAETPILWLPDAKSWKRPQCWERLRAGGEGDDRGWDGWMASLTQWTWVWVNSGSWWWTGRPGVRQFMGSRRVRHDWATELTCVILNVHPPRQVGPPSFCHPSAQISVIFLKLSSIASISQLKFFQWPPHCHQNKLQTVQHNLRPLVTSGTEFPGLSSHPSPTLQHTSYFSLPKAPSPSAWLVELLTPTSCSAASYSTEVTQKAFLYRLPDSRTADCASHFRLFNTFNNINVWANGSSGLFFFFYL